MSDETASLAQWVILRLQASEYALPVKHVREVLRMVAVTPVPQAPLWQPGVINLRGRIIPVIDLRTRLGLPPEDAGLNTPIIVTEADGRMFGLIADAVTEVLALPADGMAAPADRVHPNAAVTTLARPDGRLALLLDLERLCAGFDERPFTAGRTAR